MKKRCSLCLKDSFDIIYNYENLPIFQNKSYDTIDMARKSKSGSISLFRCRNCGFIFNSEFDSSVMDYGTDYHNEQNFSELFTRHMDNVVDVLFDNGFLNKNIVEIGCGKGQFMDRLKAAGFKVTGFDPAYEGDNPDIVKDYFSEKYSGINSDLVIMRHTLEHIEDPMKFLKIIAKSCGYKGSVFIEVPDFDWIVDKGAFWDLCHEHCNYFTMESLGNIFSKSKQGHLFGGQYMYILADFKDLKKSSDGTTSKRDYSGNIFREKLDRYKKFVGEKMDLILWGAGTKGVLLANLTDPERKHISCLVDINPNKQYKYIPLTGHPVVPPFGILNLVGEDVVVMNNNYMEEARQAMRGWGFNILSLETCI